MKGTLGLVSSQPSLTFQGFFFLLTVKIHVANTYMECEG